MRMLDSFFNVSAKLKGEPRLRMSSTDGIAVPLSDHLLGIFDSINASSTGLGYLKPDSYAD